MVHPGSEEWEQRVADLAARLAGAATLEATRAAMQEAVRAVSSDSGRRRAGSFGDSGGGSRFGRSWLKAADECGLPRLGRKATFSTYCGWKAAAERWARSVGADMGELEAQQM